MVISDIIYSLECLAPPSLQESYDNSGLITGNPKSQFNGIICCLDLTEEVLDEAIFKGINFILSHHPILFKPLKSLTPSSIIQRILIKAIKNDIAIYAIHTNYDNVIQGVNSALAGKIGLSTDSLKILSPISGKIAKLYTFVPLSHAEALKNKLFEAGAGVIGKYDNCSFETKGTGNFRPLEGTNPFIGQSGGNRESLQEVKLEIIFPIWLKANILTTLKANHPYEEVAYEIIITENEHPEIGAGIIGELPEAVSEHEWIDYLKNIFKLPIIRTSKLIKRPIKKVAICGGAGAFLIKKAIEQDADAYLTSDLKYHDFFEPDGKMLLIDIGHYESEIPSINQITNYLQEKFPTFAVLQTKINTNSVQYH